MAESVAVSIGGAFDAAREEGRAAVMPYMMGGFPDSDTARAVANAYADAGADLIELGIPFSDPLADGPVIHAAATTALDGGATVESALDAVAEVSGRLPVVAMVYSNMILAAGPEKFAGLLADAGLAGAIVPDLPLGEGADIREALSDRGLSLVPLVARTTSPERRRAICEGAEGFVYLVSTVGVTGEREGIPPELKDFVEAAKSEASVPAAVGFGISTPEQVAEVGSLADGVIVGTRLVRAVGEAGSPPAAAEAVSDFIGASREALAGN